MVHLERPTHLLSVVAVEPERTTAAAGGAIDIFTLGTGHRVAVYLAGEVGVPSYADHEIVLLEDAGSRELNLAAALAAVARRNT